MVLTAKADEKHVGDGMLPADRCERRNRPPQRHHFTEHVLCRQTEVQRTAHHPVAPHALQEQHTESLMDLLLCTVHSTSVTDCPLSYHQAMAFRSHTTTSSQSSQLTRNLDDVRVPRIWRRQLRQVHEKVRTCGTSQEVADEAQHPVPGEIPKLHSAAHEAHNSNSAQVAG
jgi:hypothetical protein